MAGAQKRQKRKHNSGDNLKLKPDEQQVFRGLAFFYVPDNDIAPVRRMRIGKAREYGAEWTRSVADASHIIVEKALDYKAVQGFLFQASATKPPIVVNENYPIDCIQFGSILDPDQAKYRVTGQPAPIAAESTRAGTEKSNPAVLEDLEGSSKSLPVKAPPTNSRRWDYVPPPGTPSRSGQSSLAAQEAPSESIGSQIIAVEAADLVASPPPVAHEPEQTSEENLRRTDGGAKDQATAQPADELSEMISVMVEFKDLPVDLDDDLDNHGGSKSRHSDDDISSPGSGNERPRSKFVKYHQRRNGNTTTGKRLGFEERFACNQAGVKDAKAGNPNARTIEVLQKMADYYNRTNDHWRTTSYRKAISTLKRQTERITTEEEAFKLPSVGRRLAQKIEEIVTTDRLRRLEYAQQDPMTESLQLFLGIYGVGTSLAQQWIAQGYKTLDDLSAKAKLTPNQRLGIEHYDDLNTRIPRKEMVELGKLVTQEAGRVDPEAEMIIGGSFRRGAESSGDIDFIITKRDTTSTAELVPFMQELVRRLEGSGFLVARLASSRSEGDGSKWHGCCVLPFTPGFHSGKDANHSSDAGVRKNYRPVWRRIDFLLVPESERGAALLYFTGNDIFNRSMRLLASRKSMRLNQRGLYKDVMRGSGRQKLSEGELVEGRDERRIFEVLGVRWREPHERWC
jgi:DNA polymerase IV